LSGNSGVTLSFNNQPLASSNMPNSRTGGEPKSQSGDPLPWVRMLSLVGHATWSVVVADKTVALRSTRIDATLRPDARAEAILSSAGRIGFVG
jgi:hypothetical protein